MKALLVASIIVLLSSCSILKTSKVHTQMSQEIAKDGMDISKDELLKKLSDSFNNTDFRFDAKLVVVSSMPPVSIERETEIRERLEDGFTYKNKFYSTTPDFGLDLFTADAEALKDKLFKARFHVLENSEDRFMIVRSDQVFVGRKVDQKKTVLEVYKLKDVVQPLQLNVNWLSLVNKGSLFNISDAPVDLEASLKYKYRDSASELKVYFELVPDIANAREQEILRTL